MSNLLKKTGVLSFVLIFFFAAVSGYAATKEELYDWLDAAKQGQELSADQKSALKEVGLEPWPEIKHIDTISDPGVLQYADNTSPFGPTYDWISYDISTTGTEITGLGDDVVVGPFPLAAPFEFFGTDYNEFYFSSNGFISFTDPVTSAYSNASIPNTANPNNIVAWFWDDLNPNNGGTAYYGAVGADFVIQMNDFNEYGTAGNSVTAQIILKADGTVLIQYDAFNGTIDINGETIGIENFDGTDGIMASYNSEPVDYPYPGLAILFGYDLYPVPDANVTGTVTDANTGDPLEGVTIEIGGIQTTTDINGYYQLLSFAGTYDINATYPFYVGYSAPAVEIYDGLVHDIALNPLAVYTLWDFETDMGEFAVEPVTEWEWGMADPAFSDIAHSGDNVWATLLADDYATYADYYLTTTRSWILGSADAYVSYWHWLDYEGAYDGYNFQISVDGGQNWEILTPVEGYNYTNIWGLSEPGFSGDPLEWEEIVFDLSMYVGQNVMFRFHHGSDSSYQQFGMMFDDFIFMQEKPPTSVEVTVVDPVNALPLEGANVRFINEWGLILDAQTDVNGQVSVLEFPSGPYVLEVDYPDYYPNPYMNEVLLQDGVPFAETVELRYFYGDIAGTVIDNSEPALPVDATVTIINQEMTVQTDPLTGEFLFENVEAGICTVFVESYGHVPGTFIFEFFGGGVLETLDPFVLQRIPREPVSGYVTDYTEGQNPIEGAIVRVEGIPGAEAITDPSGFWEINDVFISGEYLFEVTFDPVGGNGFHDEVFREAVITEAPNLFFFMLHEILPPLGLQGQFINHMITLNWLQPDNHWVFEGGVIEGSDGRPVDLNLRVESLSREIEAIISRNNPDEIAKIGILEKELNIIQSVINSPQENNNLDMIWDFDGYRVMVNGEMFDGNILETFWDYPDALEARTYEIAVAADYGYGDEFLVWSEPVYIYSVPQMYSVNPEPYGWIELRPDLEGPGMPLIEDGDDANSGFVPFNQMTFNFFNTDYTEFNANSNGWLSFTDNVSGHSGSIPSPNTPNNIIAPFWEDLHLGSGELEYGVWYLSDFEAGITVVQWHTHAFSAMENEYSFEVILDHNTNEIIFQWEYALPSWMDRNPNAAGIENEFGNVAYSVSFDEVMDNAAYRFSPVGAADIASFTGRVVDLNTGRPLVGARLVARSETQMAEGFTNMYGDFAIPLIADMGIYDISVIADNHLGTVVPEVSFAETNEVYLGEIPLEEFGTYIPDTGDEIDVVDFNWIPIIGHPGTDSFNPYDSYNGVNVTLNDEHLFIYGARQYSARIYASGFVGTDGFSSAPPLDLFMNMGDESAYLGAFVTPLNYDIRQDSRVYWKYFNDTDMMVVEWYLPHMNTSNGPGDPVNFQAHILWDGTVEFHYEEVGTMTPEMLTIGLTDWMRLNPVPLNNMGEGWYPENGSSVRFTPVRAQWADLTLSFVESYGENPVSQLPVYFYDDLGHFMGESWTDMDGTLVLDRLAIHTSPHYFIEIDNPNYETTSFDFVLEEGPNQINIVLDPEVTAPFIMGGDGYYEDAIDLWWAEGVWFEQLYLYNPEIPSTFGVFPYTENSYGLDLSHFLIDGMWGIDGVHVELWRNTETILNAQLDIWDASSGIPENIYSHTWLPFGEEPGYHSGWEYIPCDIQGIEHTNILITISTPGAPSDDDVYNIYIDETPCRYYSGVFVNDVFTDSPYITYSGPNNDPHIIADIHRFGEMLYDPRWNFEGGDPGPFGDEITGSSIRNNIEEAPQTDDEGRIIRSAGLNHAPVAITNTGIPSIRKPRTIPVNPHSDEFQGTVLYYNIYRNGELVGSTAGPETFYTDMGIPEGVPFDYVIVKVVDIDGMGTPQETEASDIATFMAAMPPDNVPWGGAEVVDPETDPFAVEIFWEDPMWNEIWEPLMDLAGISIFRNGEHLFDVDPGVMMATDIVPGPGLYSYSFQAFDLAGITSDMYQGNPLLAGDPNIFFDFETDGGPFAHDDNFEWGQPTFGPQMLEGNTSLWATNLAGYYLDESLFTLISPLFHVLDDNAFMTFEQFTDFELWFDGGAIFVSTDLGNTWEQVGLTSPEHYPLDMLYWSEFYGGLYDNPLGTFLEPGSFCFSGDPGAYEETWQLLPLYLGDYAGMDIQVAFIGGSDRVGHMHAGWYLDNFGFWNMDFTQFGMIDGTVSHMGTPLEGIPVLLTNGAMVYETTSNPDGTYSFVDVPYGDWGVIVDAPGYNYFEGMINVGETATGDLDIALTMPILEVDPLVVDMVVYPGYTGIVDLNIINIGDGELFVYPDVFQGLEISGETGQGEISLNKKSGKNAESQGTVQSGSDELDELPWFFALQEEIWVDGDDGHGPYIDIAQFQLEIPADANLYTDWEAEIVLFNNTIEELVIVPAIFHILPEATERIWEFDSGWNLVSHDLLLPDESLETIFADDIASGNLVMVKNGAGDFMVPDVIDNIGMWNALEGYWVNVTDPTAVLLSAPQVSDDYPINLDGGWSIVSYLPDYMMPADYALGSLGENLIIAKAGDGSFYLPEFGYNGIGDMMTTYGYQVKLAESGMLQYPDAGGSTIASSGMYTPAQVEPQHFILETEESVGNMSVLLTSADVNGVDIKVGDEIAVYDPRGNRAGVAVWNERQLVGLTIWGDNPDTEEIEGFHAGEELYLKLWMAETDLEMAVSLNIIQSGNDEGAIYQKDGFIIASLDGDLSSIIPTDYFISQNYPNPFNPLTTINYGLPVDSDVKVEVFNLLGQRIATILDTKQKAGYHNVTWNAINQASGTYFYRIQAESFVQVKKMVLMK